MTEDKLFNLLVARIQTRETSTVAIMLITASTSLILLGFVCPVNEEQLIPLVCIGILYPILGMSYREIAYRTMQKHDLEEINKNFNEKEVAIALGRYPKWPRLAIFYLSFVALPIGLWVLVLTNKIC